MKPLIDLGNVKVYNVSGGRFSLDAGAMTGMVPKPLWEKAMEVDHLQRVRLECNVAVVETPDRLILIDAGIGTKLDAKTKEIYSLEETDLREEIAGLGFSPDDVSDVVLTHLHFDHVGGLTRSERPDRAVPVFPGAPVHVQAAEWRSALAPSVLTRRTYLQENLLPLSKAGLLRLVEGYEQIFPGVEVFRTGGHSDGHQVVRIEGSKGVLFHLGDLVPDTVHLRLPWVMAYDRDTFLALRAKKRFLERTWKEQAVLWLGHDSSLQAGRVSPDATKPFYHFEAL